MTFRPKPKYATRSAKAGPWSTCDRCGFNWNLSRLQWQYDFLGGSSPQRTGYLHCPRCLDSLRWQNKLLIIPPDPPPIYNTRPEPYAVDETNWLTSGETEVGGDIITSGITNSSGPALISNQPNPSDVADTSVLTTRLSYPGGSLSGLYLDLFNGDPSTSGVSILATITGSATRTDIAGDLSLTDTDQEAVNTGIITVTSASLGTTNVSWAALYSASSGGTLLAHARVSATFPTIVLGAVVRFDALGLTVELT